MDNTICKGCGRKIPFCCCLRLDSIEGKILEIKLALDSNLQNVLNAKTPTEDSLFWDKFNALRRELDDKLWDLWHTNKKDAYLDLYNSPKC